MNATRREFFRRRALGLAASACAGPGAFELRADPLGFPIGCQTFPVRNELSRDFDGTLRQLAGMGYRTIEMCSPPGYADAGFGPLVNIKAAEMRRRIQDAGLRCESCHFQFRELKAHMDERIAFARELGLKQMVVATFALHPDATLSDWTRSADELNRLGEQTQKAGIQLGFHNHDFEFHEIDGVLIYDKLMETFEPSLIRLQFQVAVIRMGYRAATYLRKYPNRFLSMHLTDWSPAESKFVPVGSGAVDWKDLFTAARTGGISNYFVEMQMDALKPSYIYLHSLPV
jgi:sugar phosphate isomerase/epimerase